MPQIRPTRPSRAGRNVQAPAGVECNRRADPPCARGRRDADSRARAVPSSGPSTAIRGTPDSSLMTTPRLVRAGFPRIAIELAMPPFPRPARSHPPLRPEYSPLGILDICTLVQSASDVFPNAAQCDPRGIHTTRSPFWCLPTKPGCGVPRTKFAFEKDCARLDRSDEENEDIFAKPGTRFGIQLTLGGLAWCGTSRRPDSPCRRSDIS
jgi:hypothetical protein